MKLKHVIADRRSTVQFNRLITDQQGCHQRIIQQREINRPGAQRGQAVPERGLGVVGQGQVGLAAPLPAADDQGERGVAVPAVDDRTAVDGDQVTLLQHPVAGQGFNLSLRDIDRLARVLRERWTQPGELAVLQEYVQRSHGDQSQTILLSDSLPRIFNHDSWPLTLGRNLGLLSLDGVPPLRRAFARRGMGFNP